jgi:(heptosyl)LPS beta-1,4-glucosyltransferase
MRLTAIILTKNEAAHIAACIESVGFADHILVFDSYSDDDTVTIAETHDAQVIQRRFDNYTNQRNAALDAVRGKSEWALFVDADERISPSLAREIFEVINAGGIETRPYSGYRIPRHNYIFGKLTCGAGWYPDYQTRLLRVDQARYDPSRQVHETVLLEGELGTLQEPIIHYNYRDLAQFLEKQRRYTAFEAQAMYDAGVKPKPQNYVLQPLRHFKWRFIELKGYVDGLHGLRLSLLMAWYEFQKYLMLRRLWRNLSR